ncbi:MAG: acetate--CoA ligase family protein [Promethearchaeota archaeon]
MIDVFHDIPSLKWFFEPKSVAIIGASAKIGKIGNVIFQNFTSVQFGGKVYPVNPKETEILGYYCYKSVKDIPEEVDLAIIAIPAKFVPPVVKECGEKGVKSIIIVSAGFAEIGGEGAILEREIISTAKKFHMRLLGPNCIGVFDANTHVDTIFLPVVRMARPNPGKIAVISQSGAFMSSLLDWTAAEGLGLSKAISIGNKADVDESDLLEYLADDPYTKVITAYLESVKNGNKFIKITKKVTKHKPIILMKAGRTKGGASAAASHTGALAGSDEVFKAVFRQVGILRVENSEQMLDLANSLAFQLPAKGDRILIVTNGGGAGVMAVDKLEQLGLKVPVLSEELQNQMMQHYPSYCVARNPVDLTGDCNAERYRIALELGLSSDEVDAALVILLFQTPTLEIEAVDVVQSAQRFKKPIVVACVGGELAAVFSRKLEKFDIPVYPIPERAALAMWGLVEHGKWLHHTD